MLLSDCVLLCFSSHMCKKHYKTNQKSCFLHVGSPNPLFYRCKFLAMFISLLIFFKPFVLRRFEKLLLRSAAGWRWFCFTLCVCVSVYSPLWLQNENPIRSETSVREWQPKTNQETTKKTYLFLVCPTLKKIVQKSKKRTSGSNNRINKKTVKNLQTLLMKYTPFWIIDFQTRIIPWISIYFLDFDLSSIFFVFSSISIAKA